MSLYDFRRARDLAAADEPFAALVMAAMLRADSWNADRLEAAFPSIHAELHARYHAGGGLLAGDDGYDEVQAARAELGMPPT